MSHRELTQERDEGAGREDVRPWQAGSAPQLLEREGQDCPQLRTPQRVPVQEERPDAGAVLRKRAIVCRVFPRLQQFAALIPADLAKRVEWMVRFEQPLPRVAGGCWNTPHSSSQAAGVLECVASLCISALSQP